MTDIDVVNSAILGSFQEVVGFYRRTRGAPIAYVGEDAGAYVQDGRVADAGEGHDIMCIITHRNVYYCVV